MAKSKLETIVEELAATRLRLGGGQWHGEQYTAMVRVTLLEKLPVNQTGDELHRHIVVAAIAALQSFHRAVIISLVNSGPAYEERAAALVNEKFTLREALSFFGRGKLSAAELIGHTAANGSIHSMAEALGTILDCDIKAALAGAVPPQFRNDPEAAPVVADIEALFAQLREAFKLRNILAHEVAPLLFVKAEQAQEISRAVGQWMAAVEGLLWSTAYSDQPLTQLEMNVAAGDRLREKRRELASVLRKAWAVAKATGATAQFRANQTNWQAAVKEWTQIAYWSNEGSMWRGVGADELSRWVAQRSASLREWVRWNTPM